jgi:hypothetical protein
MLSHQGKKAPSHYAFLMAIEEGMQLATSIGGKRTFGTCPQPCEHQIYLKQAAESVHTIQEKLVAQDGDSGGHLVRLVPLFLWQTCMHAHHALHGRHKLPHFFFFSLSTLSAASAHAPVITDIIPCVQKTLSPLHISC